MLRRDQRSPRKYLTRKTIRTPQKKEKTPTKLKNKENLSKKDEKRLIKSLKSQKHKYFTSKLNDTVKRLKTFSDIPLCTIVQATEEDLKNPIAFFENLWENNKPSTGIIKIVPPKSWLNQNMKTFSDSYFKRFLESKTKLQIRSQKLNKLYLAKVSLLVIYSVYNSFSRLFHVFSDFLFLNSEYVLIFLILNDNQIFSTLTQFSLIINN